MRDPLIVHDLQHLRDPERVYVRSESDGPRDTVETRCDGTVFPHAPTRTRN